MGRKTIFDIKLSHVLHLTSLNNFQRCYKLPFSNIHQGGGDWSNYDDVTAVGVNH